MKIMPEIPYGFDRYNPEASTCNRDTLYSGFFDGFFGKFQDSFFYTGVIQFIIVSLMYAHVGKGKYWKILFYGASASLLGSLLENITVAYLCLKSNEQKEFSFVPSLLINELFWIPAEYAIPYLNLIKMNAFIKNKSTKIIKYVVIGLFFPFILFRLLIGYERMMKGYLQSPVIHTYHGWAFSIMAIADILCTFSILYNIRKNKKRHAIKTSNVNEYIKLSSYTILINIDIASTILSILNILINMGPLKDSIPSNYIVPLHCLKCSFILILAADALLFKYETNTGDSRLKTRINGTGSSIPDSIRININGGTGNLNSCKINYKGNPKENDITDTSVESIDVNSNCVVSISTYSCSSKDEINKKSHYNNNNNNNEIKENDLGVMRIPPFSR